MIAGATFQVLGELFTVTFDQPMDVTSGELTAWVVFNAAGKKRVPTFGGWIDAVTLSFNTVQVVGGGPPLTGIYAGEFGPSPVRAATGVLLADVASFPVVQV